MSFIDDGVVSDPLRRRLRRLTSGERREEALAFIDLFYRETREGDDVGRLQRRAEAARLLAKTGHYDHTSDELAFGARVAWRNSARCIGRLFWKSLDVVDCRHIDHPDSIAAHLVKHLKLAGGGDRTRSVISIFAPMIGKTAPAYVESAQLLQFAGHVQPEGRVIGDPANAEATRTAIALGWMPPAEPTDFDILPVIIRDTDGRRRLYQLPEDAYRLVDIRHPEHPALADLGLRWYAIPVISDMVLTIGGIDYPCAPFNGYYMATEIASRDLTDLARYDRLAQIGAAFGLDPADPLWRDAALTEFNRAVLHSFQQVGVSIVDHHRASEQFIEFVQIEQTCGRTPSADWAWIVPPQASAACPVFHLEMSDVHDVPNFYRSRASDGGALRVNLADNERSPLRVRLDNLNRRWRSWRRRRYGR